MKDTVEQRGDLVAVHNISAKNLLDTFELGGFPMPSIAVTKAGQLKEFVIDALKNKGVDIEAEIERISQYGDEQDRAYATREAQESELVADMMWNVFSDKKYADKLVKKDKTFARNFAKHIGEFSDAIKRALKMLSIKKTDMKATWDDVETLDKIRDMLLDAYKKASENFKAKETKNEKSTVKYSIRDSVSEYGIKNINDYINVQKSVIKVLKEQNFLGDNNRLVIFNESLGADIELNYKGIKETLGSGTRYQNLPKDKKLKKIATIKMLPEILKNAVLLRDNEENYHNSNSKIKYAYLESNVEIDGIQNTVILDIRKSETKNMFWLHNIKTVNQVTTTSRADNSTKRAPTRSHLIYEDDYTSSKIKSQEQISFEKKFSMKDTVEQRGDLVAVHNISAKNLLDTFELGGFPMPSIAVTKAGQGFNKFGDISVVFKKSTVDPQANRNNRVFSNDAYTPTFPNVEYKANQKVVDKLHNAYYELRDKFGYDSTRPLYNYVYDTEKQLSNANGDPQQIIEKLKSNTDLMNLFIQAQGGERIAPIYNEKVSRISEENIKRYEAFVSAIGEDTVNQVSGLGVGRLSWLKNNEDKVRKAYRDMLTTVEGMSKSEAGDFSENISLGDIKSFFSEVLKYHKNGAESVSSEYDYAATKKKIQETVDMKSYEEWLHNLFDGITEKKGIPNDKDPFTASENRRSFEASYLPCLL